LSRRERKKEKRENEPKLLSLSVSHKNEQGQELTTAPLKERE
jgi:hypothetical protein